MLTNTLTFIKFVPVIAIAIFALFAIAAFIKRENSTLFTGLLGIGAILADAVLLWCLNSTSFFFDALQVGTLDADYSGIFESVQNSELLNNVSKENAGFKDFYAIVVYVFAFLTPLIFAGFLLSFFKTFFDEIRFSLFGKFRATYIFSELNENSLRLAFSIRNNKKNALIVFCKSENASNETEKFILINKMPKDLVEKPRQTRHFFMLSDDEDKNFETAQEIIAEYEKRASQNLCEIKIHIQSEKPFHVLAMDSRQNKHITVNFINKSEIAANELLFQKPLFTVLNGKNGKKIKMLIIGTGQCADMVLRLAISSSQMGKEYSTNFIVLDEKATLYRERILREKPELFVGEHKIDFFDVNIETIELKKILDKEGKDVNYMAVCLEDDDLNFQTAVYLRSYFIRKDPESVQKPFIGVYMQNDNFDNMASLLASGKEEFSLFPFGSLNSVFSYNLIVNSELEKLALNIHACYSWNKENPTPREKLIQSYNRSETDKKSNRANAVHIKTKLFVLGYGIKPKLSATKEEIKNSKVLVEELLKKLHDKRTLDFLAQIEHSRWNAHERSDGWVSVSKEIAKSNKDKAKTHKFNVAKMHPCLCSWEELDALGELLAEDFKKYDIRICEFMPQILGLVEDGNINISNVEYVLFPYHL